MKKIILLLAVTVSAIGLAQQGEFHLDGQPVGPSLTIDSSSASIDHFAVDTLYMVNTGSVALEISFSRTRRYHKSGWTDQVCDCLICFNTTDTEVWDRPASPALSIAPGDSCVLQPKVYPNGIDGCSIYTYTVEAQNHTYIDSIQVTYTTNGGACFLGNTELEKETQVSVYPNPANTVLNVNIDNSNAQIDLFNIVGEKVLIQNLKTGINTLNIENLKSGVYFYRIKINNDEIETKKLIIE